MKKNVMYLALAAALMMTSCASKKDLANCQTENKSLTESLQAAKEDLAAKNARVSSLEEQLAAQRKALEEQKKAYAALQASPARTTSLLRNWWIRSTSRTSISVIWWR